MRKRILGVVASVLAGATVASGALAEVIVLDFENLAAGQRVDGRINSTVSLSTSGGAGEGIIFDTRMPTSGDGDLVPEVNRTPGVSPEPFGNVLIVAERLTDSNMDGLVDNPDDNGGGGVFRFDFDVESTFFGFAALDVTDGAGSVTIDLFSGDNSIFSFTIDDVAGAGVDLVTDIGDNVFFGLYENIFGENGISGVTAAEITLTGSGGIDGLSYAPVPVPAALPLMATALGFGGFVSRRRKRSSKTM